MARPSHRLVAKNKETGTYIEIGAMWPSQIPGAFNITFHRNPSDERKMDALNPKLKSEDWFFNVFETRDKDEDRPRSQAKRKPAQEEEEF